MAAENYSVLLKAITATEPTFNFSLRGYDRRQVDQYAQRTESQLATTLAENRDLTKQLKAMAGELKAVRDEVTELRQRPAIGEELSFKHLGLRVEQILTDAQEESTFLRKSAAEEADRVRTHLYEEVTRERAAAADEAAHVRAEAADEVATIRTAVAEEVSREREQLAEEVRQTHELRTGVLAELDEARQACAAEEARIAAEMQRVEADIARVGIETGRMRQEAEAVVSAAHVEYERVTASAMETAEKIHADLAVQMRTLREEANAEATSVTYAAQQFAGQTMAEAEQHAAEVHELVQKYLSRLNAIEAPAHYGGHHGRELSATSMRALSDRPADGTAEVSEIESSEVTAPVEPNEIRLAS